MSRNPTIRSSLTMCRMRSALRAVRRDMLDLLALVPGLAVLEVGCGTGEDARAIADHVGATGRVVALDLNAPVLDEARRRAQGVPGTITFVQGDVQRLDYADASFDRCYCERVLQHVPDPAAAIRELVRVIRPGGRIVVADSDWGTCICSDLVTQAVYETIGRHVHNPTLGRALAGLLRESGLRDISVRPHLFGPIGAECDEHYVRLSAPLLDLAVAAGTASAADTADWPARLRADGRDGVAFGLVAFFVAVGTKPS
jgi:SAM-dependent methyltransferase